MTIAAGQIQGSFSVSSIPVVAPLTASIVASVPGSARGANFGVLAPILLSLSVTPSTVQGGSTSIGLVRLTGKAAIAMTVNLSVNGSVAAVPQTVVVSSGAREASFQVTTLPVTLPRSLTVIARHGAVRKTTTLTVTP
jgi:hypothetical protein